MKYIQGDWRDSTGNWNLNHWPVEGTLIIFDVACFWKCMNMESLCRIQPQLMSKIFCVFVCPQLNPCVESDAKSAASRRIYKYLVTADSDIIDVYRTYPMGPCDLQQKKVPISNARQQTAVFGMPQEVSPVDVDCIEPWAEQLMNNPLVSIKYTV